LSVGEIIASTETAPDNILRIEPVQSSTPERTRVLLLVALLASLIVVALFVWALLALPLTTG